MSKEETILRIKSLDGPDRHIFKPEFFGIEIVSMREDQYGELTEKRYALKSSHDAKIYIYEELPE